MHKNFPTPGGILLSLIPRLDARKTQGKQENSIIFTSQHCYISKGTCLITIQSAFNTLYISKYKINRFFKKQFEFSAKAAESVTFENSSHCSDWPGRTLVVCIGQKIYLVSLYPYVARYRDRVLL